MNIFRVSHRVLEARRNALTLYTQGRTCDIDVSDLFGIFRRPWARAGANGGHGAGAFLIGKGVTRHGAQRAGRAGQRGGWSERVLRLTSILRCQCIIILGRREPCF